MATGERTTHIQSRPGHSSSSANYPAPATILGPRVAACGCRR